MKARFKNLKRDNVCSEQEDNQLTNVKFFYFSSVVK